MEERERERIATRAAIIGILANLFLFIVKYALSFLLHSLSIGADAWNNLSDMGNSLISLFAGKISGKKADREHPFGHGRIEYLAAFLVSTLIIQLGFQTIRSALFSMGKKEELSFFAPALWILTLSVLVKVFLFFYFRFVGKKISSTLFKATSMDALLDSLMTLSTLFSTLLYYKSGYNIDAILGLLLGALILFNGAKMAKETITEILGKPIEEELYEKIRKTILTEKEFLEVHDFLYHPYGAQNAMGSIHVQCDGGKTIAFIHEKVDDMERRIKKEFGFSLLIHVDPVVSKKLEGWLSTVVREVLTKHDAEGSFHDVQFKREREEKSLYFDLLLPYSVTDEKASIVMEEIKALVKEEKGMNCVIELDRPVVDMVREDEISL